MVAKKYSSRGKCEETYIINVRRVTQQQGESILQKCVPCGPDENAESGSSSEIRKSSRKKGSTKSRSVSPHGQGGGGRSRSRSVSPHRQRVGKSSSQTLEGESSGSGSEKRSGRSRSVSRRSMRHGYINHDGTKTANSNPILKFANYLNELLEDGIQIAYSLLNSFGETLCLWTHPIEALQRSSRAIGDFRRWIKQKTISFFIGLYNYFFWSLTTLANVLYDYRGLWYLLFLLGLVVVACSCYWKPMVGNWDFDQILHLGRKKPDCIQMVLGYFKHPMKFVYKLCIFCPD